MTQPGHTLSHYRLIEKIGEGGMGVVWKAEDKEKQPPGIKTTGSTFLLICFLSGALGLFSQTLEAKETEDTGKKQKISQLVKKGENFLKKENPSKALTAFHKANSLAKGQSMEALMGLARADFKLLNYNSTIKFARKILEMTNDPTLCFLANNYLGLSVFKQEMDKYPGGFWIAEYPKNNWPGKDTLKQAEGAFRKALELSGGRANTARYNLAETLYWMNQKDEASKMLEEYFLGGGDLDRAHQLHCILNLKQPKEILLAGIEDVTNPERIRYVRPAYPDPARRGAVEGEVTLQAIICADGTVVDLKVLKGPGGIWGFEQASIDAARKWLYKPALKNGKPVDVYFTIVVKFYLEKTGTRP